MVYRFFETKIGSGASVNEEPAQELHKPVIEKFKLKRVYARFKENIQEADLAVMGSLYSNNQGAKYLSCVIDIFSKQTWVKTELGEKIKKQKQFFMILLKQ